MLILKEEQGDLKTILKPLVFKYKKLSASSSEAATLVDHLAAVLDTWEYTPQEIQSLDKDAFFDLVGECCKKSINKQVYTKVLDF